MVDGLQELAKGHHDKVEEYLDRALALSIDIGDPITRVSEHTDQSAHVLGRIMPRVFLRQSVIGTKEDVFLLLSLRNLKLCPPVTAGSSCWKVEGERVAQSHGGVLRE